MTSVLRKNREGEPTTRVRILRSLRDLGPAGVAALVVDCDDKQANSVRQAIMTSLHGGLITVTFISVHNEVNFAITETGLLALKRFEAGV